MKDQIRILVRGAYDLQKLRIAMGNRLAVNFRSKLGQKPGESEKVLPAEAAEILDVLRSSYGRLSDGLADNIRSLSLRNFKGDSIISSFTEYVLVAQYIELERSEREHFKRIEQVLSEVPIYNAYLKDVKGIGPHMAAVIISEIDISKATYPSSIWKYSGLDVGPDGRGRGRYVEHLIDVAYIDKDGNDAIRKSITFNPWLKTKLVGVLGSSFLRCGPNPYRQVYDDYKNRIENMEEHADKSRGHRHNMAIRFMVKRFLVDLYIVWRELDGLPVAEEYSVAKLGMEHKVA